MAAKLKPIKEQVIVITGASSGIGRVTARMAAEQGAKVVLAARNEEALRQIEQEINSSSAPGRAAYVVADVGKEEDVRRIAQAATERFGGFDTWVNNAGVSIYGRIEEIAIEDFRRLFDTNFWGMVHGARTAVEHLRTRGGGSVINIGSAVSDRAIPLQGMYVASKHAIKGFTDSLRMELEEAGAPVSVTLIKPAAIDTPFTQHAKNYMEEEPDFPPPVYAPEIVAQAILHAAATPARDIMVGGAAKMFQVMDKYTPRAGDRYMEATMFEQQKKSGRPETDRGDKGLYTPGGGAYAERGGYEGHVAKTSVYTQATMHPIITGAILATAGVAVAALIDAVRSEQEEDKDWKHWARHPVDAARRAGSRVRGWVR